MGVSDYQVAALRVFLALEPYETERLTKQLVETDRLEGYGELVYADDDGLDGFLATARVLADQPAR